MPDLFVAADELIFMASGAKVIAIHRNTGKRLSVFSIQDGTVSSLAVGMPRLLVGSSGGVVTAFDIISGMKCWEYSIPLDHGGDTKTQDSDLQIISLGCTSLSAIACSKWFLLSLSIQTGLEQTCAIQLRKPAVMCQLTKSELAVVVYQDGTLFVNRVVKAGFNSKLEELWTAQAETDANKKINALTACGTFLIACSDRIYCFSLEGRQIWSSEIKGGDSSDNGEINHITSVSATMLEVGIRVVVGRANNVVQCYGSDGEFLWERKHDRCGEGAEGVTTIDMLAEDSGVVFTGAWDHCIRAWDINSGEVVLGFSTHIGEIHKTYTKFRYDSADHGSHEWAVQKILLISKTEMISGGHDGHIRKWDMRMGKHIWGYMHGTNVFYSQVFGLDVFLGGSNYSLQKWDSVCGQNAWTTSLGPAMRATCIDITDPLAFVAVVNHSVFAVNIHTGTVAWSGRPTQNWTICVKACGDTVITASNTGSSSKLFVGWGASTGERKWEKEISANIEAAKNLGILFWQTFPGFGKAVISVPANEGGAPHEVWSLEAETGEIVCKKAFESEISAMMISTFSRALLIIGFTSGQCLVVNATDLITVCSLNTFGLGLQVKLVASARLYISLVLNTSTVAVYKNFDVVFDMIEIQHSKRGRINQESGIPLQGHNDCVWSLDISSIRTENKSCEVSSITADGRFLLVSCSQIIYAFAPTNGQIVFVMDDHVDPVSWIGVTNGILCSSTTSQLLCHSLMFLKYFSIKVRHLDLDASYADSRYSLKETTKTLRRRKKESPNSTDQIPWMKQLKMYSTLFTFMYECVQLFYKFLQRLSFSFYVVKPPYSFSGVQSFYNSISTIQIANQKGNDKLSQFETSFWVYFSVSCFFVIIVAGHRPLKINAFVNPGSRWSIIWNAILFFSKIVTGPALIPIVRNLLSSWSCEVIEAELQVSCWSGPHLSLAIPGLISLILYLVMFIRLLRASETIAGINFKFSNPLDWSWDVTNKETVVKHPLTESNRLPSQISVIYDLILVGVAVFLKNSPVPAAIVNFVGAVIIFVVFCKYDAHVYPTPNLVKRLFAAVLVYSQLIALVVSLIGSGEDTSAILIWTSFGSIFLGAIVAVVFACFQFGSNQWSCIRPHRTSAVKASAIVVLASGHVLESSLTTDPT